MFLIVCLNSPADNTRWLFCACILTFTLVAFISNQGLATTLTHPTINSLLLFLKFNSDEL